jgi:hypothetical protein
MVTSDGDVPVRVAVDLDAGPVHPLDPGVEVLLRRGDVASVRRLDARIRLAERHGAFGERAVAGVFRGRPESDPFVAKARSDAFRDHRLQHIVLGLVAHAMQEVAAGAHLLQGEQVATLVMHARKAVADELPGNEGQRVTVARQRLI